MIRWSILNGIMNMGVVRATVEHIIPVRKTITPAIARLMVDDAKIQFVGKLADTHVLVRVCLDYGTEHYEVSFLADGSLLSVWDRGREEHIYPKL